ncbi:MAG: hypothetical protein J6S67_04390 [Methanobrevibacter sp.]|nr:hypothetical protein [Methanobrevibacter sp.]
MRTFRLYDNDGNRYNLTSRDHLFFYAIDGLGFEQSAEFQRIEDRFALLESHIEQATIEGTIKFWQPEAELQYFNFAQFCQNQPIMMDYNNNYGTYSRRGIITKIERGDGDGNELLIKIQFKAQTPWFKEIIEYNPGTESGGKVYNYSYDYTYLKGGKNTITIDSDSFQSSPVKLVVIGPAINPSWRHYLNGELVTEGKINGIIGPDNRLIVDTTTIPYRIIQVDALGQLVSDLYQQSDFSTYRFVRFGHGRNTVTFSADESNILNVGVEAQIEYATI